MKTTAEHQKGKLVLDTENEFIGRKGTNKGKIKQKNPEDRLKKLRDHFQNLLQQPLVNTSKLRRTIFQRALPISTENFTMEELKKSIKDFNSNKTLGLVNISIKACKTGTLNVQLLEVCNKTLNGGRAEIWVKSGIIPLPKKGHLGGTGNYCRISLTVVAAINYIKLLLDRIRPHLNPLLLINQNGCRSGRSTLVRVITLRRLI